MALAFGPLATGNVSKALAFSPLATGNASKALAFCILATGNVSKARGFATFPLLFHLKPGKCQKASDKIEYNPTFAEA
jgi:hypothetical protein